MDAQRVYPDQLARAEKARVRLRRRQAEQPKIAPVVGFALSGGGIRSATFCFGLFQSLARKRLLGKIDFLSTVSGGGYFGSFLGALFTRPGNLARWFRGSGDTTVRVVERVLEDNESEPVKWLRESGRYLSPVSAGDTLLAVASYLRNLVAFHLVLGAALVGIFLLADAFCPLLDRTGVWGAPTAGGWFWWSPWMRLASVPLALVAIPACWAHFLTQRKEGALRSVVPALVTAAVAVMCLIPDLGLRGVVDRFLGWDTRAASRAAALLAVLALVYWGFFEWKSKRDLGKFDPNPSDKDPRERPPTRYVPGDLEFEISNVRNHLSQVAKAGMLAAVVIEAFALVDSLGQSLYIGWFTPGGSVPPPWVWPPVVAVAAVLAATKRFAGLLPMGERLRAPWQVVVAAAAFGVGTLVLAGWSLVAHAFSWAGNRPDIGMAPLRSAVGALLAGLLCWGFGRTFQFLNNSSHHMLYAARLTRAYLGASNPERWSLNGSRVTEPIPGDAIAGHDYRPYGQGGPLHLINVTINETLGGRYQTEYRDRKGLGMALGPAGLSVGAHHHALWLCGEPGRLGPKLLVQRPESPAEERNPRGPDLGEPDPLFDAQEDQHEVQSRQLGEWIAISGAAFTTGLGSRTSLPLSILLGLANVRLGYWWDSRPNRSKHSAEATRIRRGAGARLLEWAFPVQASLAEEVLGRFAGPAKRYWYLSDGGHFENTGCYELIRRRVPLIVCCDCGADPGYQWADVASLVRKARIDFNAEVRFPGTEALKLCVEPDRVHDICALGEFTGSKQSGNEHSLPGQTDEPRRAAGHAVVAHVYYLDDEATRRAFDAGSLQPGSVILFVKPSLTGDEPNDVLQYAASHPSFPQEPTGDQYFDEAQWESYRKLGEHIADRVFRGGEAWSPMRPGAARV